MGIHEGHRQRLRDRFLEHGLDSFNELNALELLLCYAIPRRDTNELAHALLMRFGGLDAVFAASVQELSEVEGIGMSAATLIALIPQLMKKAGISKTRDMKRINSSAEAAMYLSPRLAVEADELVLLLCLDSKRGIICCREVGHGVVQSVDASIRKIAETALKAKAASVILAHNHPGGIARPSREDEDFTRQLHRALSVLEIGLEDHIIIAGNEYISMRDAGLLKL